jgi:hypothetical protein
MDRIEKGLDLTTEVVKQQITLSSVILGAGLAFADKVQVPPRDLAFGLAPFFIAIIFGVLALMAISFHLSKDQSNPIASSKVQWFGVLQNVFFVFGILALLILIGLTKSK